MDKAHNLTNKIISDLEKKLKNMYQHAYIDIDKKLRAILSNMELIKEGGSLNLNEAQKYNRLQKLQDQLAESIRDVNKEAVSIINGTFKNTFLTNYNSIANTLSFETLAKDAVVKIVSEQVTPFTKIAESRFKNRALQQLSMQQELTTALLQGESIPKISNRIKNNIEGNLKDATRIARTETTNVQNQARLSVMDEGERLGFTMYKRWVATADDRCREDHLKMNGLTIPKDELFELPDGSLMSAPGDSTHGASAGQVINCRCTTVPIIYNFEETREFSDTEKETQQKINKLIDREKIIDKDTGVYYNLIKGERIRNQTVFAGKGTKHPLHEGVAEGLTKKFGGDIKNWQHAKGKGIIDFHGEEAEVELHWFQEKSVGKVNLKIKKGVK